MYTHDAVAWSETCDGSQIRGVNHCQVIATMQPVWQLDARGVRNVRTAKHWNSPTLWLAHQRRRDKAVYTSNPLALLTRGPA